MVLCGIYFCRYILGAVETFLDALPQAGIFKRKMLVFRTYGRRCTQAALIRLKTGSASKLSRTIHNADSRVRCAI